MFLLNTITYDKRTGQLPRPRHYTAALSASDSPRSWLQEHVIDTTLFAACMKTAWCLADWATHVCCSVTSKLEAPSKPSFWFDWHPMLLFPKPNTASTAALRHVLAEPAAVIASAAVVVAAFTFA